MLELDIGHWINRTGIVLTEEVYHDRLGFIYRIRKNSTGHIYIGRKQFWFRRGKYWYESDWRSYSGSSRQLLDEMQGASGSEYTYELLALFSSKSALRYAEIVAIVTSRSYEEATGYNGELARCRGKLSLTEEDRQQLEHLRLLCTLKT